MRLFRLLLAISLLGFVPGQSGAFSTTVKVRAGIHPDFFRVVVEGPSDVIRSIDTGSTEGLKRELVITLSEDAVVELPHTDTWKAGPVRSMRVEDYSIIFVADPTVPLETHRFHEPDRYVFDFMMPTASSGAGEAEEEEREGVETAVPEGRTDAEPREGRPEGETPSVQAPDAEQPKPARRPRPRYSPEQQARKIKGIRRVAIDPGHGGYDLGIPGENEFVLRVAKRLDKALASVGIRTRMTRTANSFVPIGERVDMIQDFKPDVYLSIHMGRKYFRVYAGGAGSGRRAALALKTRLHSAIGLAFGEELIGEAVAPVALAERLVSPGALVEIPESVRDEGDAGLETVAGILLSVLGQEEEDVPEKKRWGWW